MAGAELEIIVNKQLAVLVAITLSVVQSLVLVASLIFKIPESIKMEEVAEPAVISKMLNGQLPDTAMEDASKTACLIFSVANLIF